MGVIVFALCMPWGAWAQAPENEAAPENEVAPENEAAPEAVEVEPEPIAPDDAADAGAPIEAIDALSDMSLEELLGLEIRVSAASLFEESNLDAGATVDLLTPEDWHRRGARRTLDAIANQPSTALYPTLWGGTGVAVRGYASGSSVRGLSIELDGVPMNDIVFTSALHFTSNVELPTLSRIEVVRGPGSAVHGTDAFHGMLAYRSYAATRDERGAGVEVGTDRFHQGYARASQGIGEDLRLNIALGYSALPDQARSYAYTDPDTGAPARGERALAYRSLSGVASLVYAPRDRGWDASIALHANHADADGAPGFGRAADARSLFADRDVSSSDTEVYLARAEVGVALPHAMRVEALGYYWYQDVSTRGPATIPTVSGPVVSDTDTHFAQARSGARLSLRQPMSAHRRTQWVGGYEYSRGHLYEGGFQTITDPETGITFRSAGFVGNAFTRNIHSLFLSAQTRVLGDVVRVHYGGRIDHYSDFGVQATPRLGLVVSPIEGLALKALYGRAFRAPSVFERRGDGADIQNNADLHPEIIDTFELVALHQTDRLRVQATGFASVWNEGIILVPVVHPSFTSRYDNVGRNRSIGVEASASVVHRGFRGEASVSYAQSRNDSAEVDYGAFPTFIGNLGLGYRIDAARFELYLFQRVQAGMTVGDPVANGALRDQASLPVYYRADVHAEWAAVREHLFVFVNVRNAFARVNTVPSLANAEFGAQTPGINASIGVRGGF